MPEIGIGLYSTAEVAMVIITNSGKGGKDVEILLPSWGHIYIFIYYIYYIYIYLQLGCLNLLYCSLKVLIFVSLLLSYTEPKFCISKLICNLVCKKESHSLSELFTITHHAFNLSPSYYTQP